MRWKIAFAVASLLVLSGCEDMSDEDMGNLMDGMQAVAAAGGGDSSPSFSGAGDPDQAVTNALIQGTVAAAVAGDDEDAGEAFAKGALQSLQNSSGGVGGGAGPVALNNTSLPGGGASGADIESLMASHPNMAIQACPGFTDENYQTRSFQGGNDTQLFTLCGGAFNYYHMYRRALEMGYAPDQAEVTYQAHRKAALVVTQFVQDSR